MIYIPRILGASLTHFSEYQGVRAFFHRTLSGTSIHDPPNYHHWLPTPLRTSLIPYPRFLSVSLSLLHLPWKLRRSYRAPLHVSAKRKLFCLANHTRSLLAPRIIIVTHTRTRVCCTCRIFSALSRNIDTRYSYLVSKRRTSNHAIRYFEKIDTL